MILGIPGILAVMVFGFLTCCMKLDEKYLYIVPAAGYILALTVAVCCMRRRCICSNMNIPEDHKE